MKNVIFPKKDGSSDSVLVYQLDYNTEYYLVVQNKGENTFWLWDAGNEIWINLFDPTEQMEPGEEFIYDEILDKFGDSGAWLFDNLGEMWEFLLNDTTFGLQINKKGK